MHKIILMTWLLAGSVSVAEHRVSRSGDDANPGTKDKSFRTISSTTASTIHAAMPSGVAISGEQKQWHKITLTLDGPFSSETATPNPFLDYRMNVTFSHPETGTKYVIPGYFAADGNAANTSAASGNKWRVHIAPDHVGIWNFTIEFRSGSNVAVGDPAAGSALSPYNGKSGSFMVAATDKTGRDFRGQGRLEYVGKHHLRFAGSGKYFLKLGSDSPENMLSYADFDGTQLTDGINDHLTKTWSAHLPDWQQGDPTWGDGKGKAMIGAINYLASEGLNGFSGLIMNIWGDDKNVFPYVNYTEHLRMDCSKLDQWAIVFDHGTKNGFFMDLKMQETENERMLDGGEVGTQRKLYYREMVARFSHNMALQWNLGEENGTIVWQGKTHPGQTTAQRIAMTQWFHDHDPYHHPVAIHNGQLPDDLLGPVSKLTTFALQAGHPRFYDVPTSTFEYINKSSDAGRPWIVTCDESGNAPTGLRPDSDPGTSHTDARKNAIWGNIMNQGGGCDFYFGYDYAHSDLTCEDYRSRDAFWDYCRYALAFFDTNNIPFQDMVADHGLTSNPSDWCLKKAGDVYLIYLKDGGTSSINLSGISGTFDVHWYDPRNGGRLQNGSVSSVTGGENRALGHAPSETTSDWVILVRKQDGSDHRR